MIVLMMNILKKGTNNGSFLFVNISLFYTVPFIVKPLISRSIVYLLNICLVNRNIKTRRDGFIYDNLKEFIETRVSKNQLA